MKKSMSDDDLRDAIREKLNSDDEDSEEDDDEDSEEDVKPKAKISLDDIRAKLKKN